MKTVIILVLASFSIFAFGQQNIVGKEKTDSNENSIIYIQESNDSIKTKESSDNIRSDEGSKDSIYESRDCQVKVSFPGGDAALVKFISQNCNYPQIARQKKIQGTVFLKFVITKAGEIGKINVLKSVDPLLENEAIRVIQMLPNWNPARIDGKPVNSWFIVPVSFKL